MEFGKSGGEVGLSLLGSISAFSVWSALNPSWFTINAFMDQKHIPTIRDGMNIGLLLDGALSAGLLLAYGKKGLIPAIITAATGIGLWLSYDQMIKKQSNAGAPNP